MSWHFIDTGLRSGAFNMRYDETLAKRLLEGKGDPTVRVYGWQPYAISLGFHQDERDIDLVRCREDGIDVVRRPTGGRAILHAHELTYSVAMFSGGRSIADIHRHISRALVQSLKHLAVAAEILPATPRLRDIDGSDAGAACFASTSRYEVQVDGKKIVGSAQRRYERAGSESVVLQHGSILLGAQHLRLGEYVGRPEAVRHLLEQRTTDVESILARQVTFDEAAGAVKRGFEETWSVSFEERVPQGSGKELATISGDSIL